MGCFRRLGPLAAVLAVFLGMAGRAEAGRVTVANKSSADVVMVFMYYDTARDYFYVRGWYRVPAGKQVYWDFVVASDKYFYWYAKSTEQQWPSRGDRTQAVIDGPMDHKFDEVMNLPRAYDIDFATTQSDGEGNVSISLVD